MAELPCIEIIMAPSEATFLGVVPSHFHHCVLFMGTWWFIPVLAQAVPDLRLKKKPTSLSRARGARRSAGRTWNRKMPLPRAAARGLAMKVRTWSWKSKLSSMKFQWCQHMLQNASCMPMRIYVNQTCPEVSQVLRTLELHFHAWHGWQGLFFFIWSVCWCAW